jgi:hypothetical protein
MKMCRQAKDAALFSIKTAIVLLISQTMLLFGPDGYDTYHILQTVRAIPEVIFAVLLAGGLGAAWLQVIHNRQERK